MTRKPLDSFLHTAETFHTKMEPGKLELFSGDYIFNESKAYIKMTVGPSEV